MYINTKTDFWRHCVVTFSILFLIISALNFGLTVGSFASDRKSLDNLISGINALMLCVFALIVGTAFFGMLRIISTSMYYDWISSKDPYIGVKHCHIPLGTKVQRFLNNYKRWSITITCFSIIIIIFLAIFLLKLIIK